MKTKPIPEGYNSVTPYIAVKGADKAIEFYKNAFGAKEVGRVTMSDGTIGHAEIEIGDSKIMLADESVQWGNLSPERCQVIVARDVNIRIFFSHFEKF